MVSEFHEQFDWKRVLRDYRQARRVSQPEVGRRAGLSVSAVKAYENGDRHPSRESLAAIIEALGMPVEEADRVLAGAGYAIDMRNILDEKYAARPFEWYATEVERFSWPVFVTNQSGDVVAANKPFRTLVGIPLREQLPTPKWNFLARASDPAFADRMVSWDRSMSFIVGLGKAEPQYEINAERPPPAATAAYMAFLQGDPAYITRLLRLWEAAEPVTHTTRMTYPVQFRHECGDVMSFTAIMHMADLWQDLSWHDWVPDDEVTVALLRRDSDPPTTTPTH